MNKISEKNLYIYCNISLIAAALISGLSFVAQKMGMIYTGPFTFNTLRCFIGSICLLPIIFIFNKITPEKSGKYSRKELAKGGIFAGIVLFMAFSINQYCMIYAQAGKAGFITSLYILFVPVIAIFLKHRLKQNVCFAIVLALGGLYLLCAKDAIHFELWDMFLLISAFFFALHITVVSYYSKKVSTLKLSCIQFLVAGLLSLPFMFFFETPVVSAILAGWKPILFMGIIVTGVAYTLQIFGHKATHPVLATLILSSEAVFAVLAGMILLGETLTLKEITGCILMITAIIISQITNKSDNDKNKRRIYMEKLITNQTFDEERALYNLKDTEVSNCTFAGTLDGESVLKEGRNYTVKNCSFSLRYPMWHAQGFSLLSSSMDEKTRAPLWYCTKGQMENSKITGIKCLRECDDVTVNNCNIESAEFGWKCRNLQITNSYIDSMYLLLESKNIEINNLKMKGKYSFQYVENLCISDSDLDTKDAFWHGKNIVVKNSTLKGEYLGWFCENLTLIDCKISGTQPLCYCKNLKLINCTMENSDLSFEYSDVEADIKGHIESVKNPKSGTITADSVGDIIMEDAVIECSAKVQIRESNLCA